MAVYTPKVLPASPLASDPMVISAYMAKGDGAAITVPCPGRGVLAHAEAHTIVTCASTDLVYTITNDASTTLGAITVAATTSAVGVEDEWVPAATGVEDYVVDNEHLTVTLAGTDASAGACMLYFVFEGYAGQRVL